MVVGLVGAGVGLIVGVGEVTYSCRLKGAVVPGPSS